MLIRLAHSQNYLAVSPSKEQVGSRQAASGCPLTCAGAELVLAPALLLFTFAQ
jgi:hypothetical protein